MPSENPLRNGSFSLLLIFGLGFGLAAGLAGCSLSRADKLERKSDKIESRLVRERDKALTLRGTDAFASSSKIDHLTILRGTLSIANGALAAVPYVFKEPEQNLAYDVLDEVYGTIDWNIPLLPGDPAIKRMPAQFAGGRVNLLPEAQPQPR